jgi:hypothetical protein
MQTAWTALAQLLPALAQGPAAPADSIRPDTVTVAAPAPRISAALVDWTALREDSASRDTARTRQRATAIEYSGFYQTRLKIHRTLSYAMIPLFIGSYVSGNAILKNRNDPPKWATTMHKPFAIATGSVFAVNTVTGLWNLWDSRKHPEGQTKRTIHSLLFIAATAGFTYTGTSLARDAVNREDRNRFHRQVAVASMGVSVVSWGMMVFLK